MASNKVMDIVQQNEHPDNLHEWAGWLNGLNKMNQDKYYVSKNAIRFTTYAKEGIKDKGFLLSPFILYYVEQEPDFSSYYYHHKIESSL